MTRQQRRKLERDSKKPQAQLVSKNGPISYGAYYKDNTDEGFVFTIDCIQGTPEQKQINKKVINMMIGTVTNMLRDYRKYPEKTKKLMVDDQWNLLHESIEEFNKLAFPNGKRGRLGVKVDITPELMKPGFMASTAIDFLTNVGEIKNDNYNGMAFHYGDAKIA